MVAQCFKCGIAAKKLSQLGLLSISPLREGLVIR